MDNKKCKSEYMKQYYIENADKIKECSKKHYEDNKEHRKQYDIDNKEHIAERQKKYYEENKEYITGRRQQWNVDNKVRIADYQKQYYEDNKERIAKYMADNKDHITCYKKEYYEVNKESIQEARKVYVKDNPDIIRGCYQRARAKRSAWGEPVEINEWFEGSELHHLHINGDHQIAIHIPKELHRSVWHSYSNQETMNEINCLIITWVLYIYSI